METIRYRSRSAFEETPQLPPGKHGAAPPASLAKYVPDTPVLDPARSRSRGGETLLPIKEERGRSRHVKALQQLTASQNTTLVKGQIRQELGRFAAAFARRRPILPLAAASVPPQPKTRTFDEIDALTSEEQPIRQKTIPLGATTQRQRVNSLGDGRVRYQGRPVVA